MSKGLKGTCMPRTFIDARGNPVPTLGSYVPTMWNGQPALEVCFFETSVLNGQPGPSSKASEPADGSSPPERSARAPGLDRLTPREQEVAIHVAEGFSTLNVAQRLGIREHTVRVHIKAIFRKTGCRSRVEIVRWMLGGGPGA